MKGIYWLWLSDLFDLNVYEMNRLLEIFGSPENIYRLKAETLLMSGINETIVNKIISSRDEKEIYKKFGHIDKLGIKYTYFGDENFPDFKSLGKLQPRVLYYKGAIPDRDEMAIAIVGARKSSFYGQNVAMRLGGQAADMGIAVISGLALGIDTYSHKGALKNGGITYAVLGCGVDVCYPAGNSRLYDEIIEKGGGIISEYRPGTPPAKIRFPMRNRIISGLSSKIIVVEAKKQSGSLITAKSGLEQGKDVYAVPGRIGDILSEGCNELIKEGAGIITDISDLLIQEKFIISEKADEKQEKLLLYGNDCEPTKEKNIKLGLEKDLQVLYSSVDLLPKSIEEIASQCGISVVEAVRGITLLQLRGLVRENIRNYYSKV